MERNEELALLSRRRVADQEPHVVRLRHWPIPRWRRFWRNPQHFERVSHRLIATTWVSNGGEPVTAPILFPV